MNNNIKVKFTNTKFNVFNSKNKKKDKPVVPVIECVTVCKVEFDTFLPGSFFDTDLGKSVFFDDTGFEFKVSAKAKCSPNDTFDEVKGKRIAESRANIKAYNKIMSILAYCNGYYLNLSECYKNKCMKVVGINKGEVNHLKTLLND